MTTIVQRDNPTLRKVATTVAAEDISSPQIQAVIKKMIKALEEQDDGVAIAAPQIGESLRIFVVSGKVFVKNYPDHEPGEKVPDTLVCINPKILKLSQEKKSVPEGCLSVRWLYGNVLRSTKAKIEAYDAQGKKFSRGGSGLLAQIFQHEIDHLDGILFTDTATDLEEMPPDKENKK